MTGHPAIHEVPARRYKLHSGRMDPYRPCKFHSSSRLRRASEMFEMPSATRRGSPEFSPVICGPPPYVCLRVCGVRRGPGSALCLKTSELLQYPVDIPVCASQVHRHVPIKSSLNDLRFATCREEVNHLHTALSDAVPAAQAPQNQDGDAEAFLVDGTRPKRQYRFSDFSLPIAAPNHVASSYNNLDFQFLQKHKTSPFSDNSNFNCIRSAYILQSSPHEQIRQRANLPHWHGSGDAKRDDKRLSLGGLAAGAVGVGASSDAGCGGSALDVGGGLVGLFYSRVVEDCGGLAGYAISDEPPAGVPVIMRRSTTLGDVGPHFEIANRVQRICTIVIGVHQAVLKSANDLAQANGLAETFEGSVGQRPHLKRAQVFLKRRAQNELGIEPPLSQLLSVTYCVRAAAPDLCFIILEELPGCRMFKNSNSKLEDAVEFDTEEDGNTS
ncbi:hypothetical protein BKA93DRAFT_749074 [Sparassis latifolia]